MPIIANNNGAVCTLQINRPEKRNAINREMYALLTQGFSDANSDPAIRAIIVKSTPGFFTAGNDIADFATAVTSGERFDAPFELMHAMLDCSKPIIAAVDGPAIGIGATMLFHCDLVYATNNAKFQTPFTDLGVCPEFASSVTFPDTLGSHKAAQMLLLGEPLSANEAVQFGLVNRLVESEVLDNTANQAATTLANKPVDALNTSRALLKTDNRKYQDVIKQEAAEFERLMGSAEFRQKLEDFLKK